MPASIPQKPCEHDKPLSRRPANARKKGQAARPAPSCGWETRQVHAILRRNATPATPSANSANAVGSGMAAAFASS